MDHTKLRDLPPFSIRLQPELRAALEREAAINGRTLSREILERLRLSLESGQNSTVLRTGEPPAAADALRQRPVSDAHRMLLALYDAMGPDKQLALLTVLRR